MEYNEIFRTQKRYRRRGNKGASTARTSVKEQCPRVRTTRGAQVHYTARNRAHRVRTEVGRVPEHSLLDERPNVRQHEWPAERAPVLRCEEVVEEDGAVRGDDGEGQRVTLVSCDVESDRRLRIRNTKARDVSAYESVANGGDKLTWSMSGLTPGMSYVVRFSGCILASRSLPTLRWPSTL